MAPPRPSTAFLAAFLVATGSLLASASCATVRQQALRLGFGGKKTDATVIVRAAEGTELGVSTEYGVVFLGRAAQSGRVQLTVWFADGASIETSVVEPVGGGLYTAQTDIVLPTVPLTFDSPRSGQEVIVAGRRGDDTWETKVDVAQHARVSGLLLESSSELSRLDGSQVGAGVYVENDDGSRALLGLLSGRLRLRAGDGTREFFTVAGPEELWRLVTYHRNLGHRKRWVYREDIL